MRPRCVGCLHRDRGDDDGQQIGERARPTAPPSRTTIRTRRCGPGTWPGARVDERDGEQLPRRKAGPTGSGGRRRSARSRAGAQAVSQGRRARRPSGSRGGVHWMNIDGTAAAGGAPRSRPCSSPPVPAGRGDGARPARARQRPKGEDAGPGGRCGSPRRSRVRPRRPDDAEDHHSERSTAAARRARLPPVELVAFQRIAARPLTHRPATSSALRRSARTRPARRQRPRRCRRGTEAERAAHRDHSDLGLLTMSATALTVPRLPQALPLAQGLGAEPLRRGPLRARGAAVLWGEIRRGTATGSFPLNQGSITSDIGNSLASVTTAGSSTSSTSQRSTGHWRTCAISARRCAGRSTCSTGRRPSSSPTARTGSSAASS